MQKQQLQVQSVSVIAVACIGVASSAATLLEPPYAVRLWLLTLVAIIAAGAFGLLWWAPRNFSQPGALQSVAQHLLRPRAALLAASALRAAKRRRELAETAIREDREPSPEERYTNTSVDHVLWLLTRRLSVYEILKLLDREDLSDFETATLIYAVTRFQKERTRRKRYQS